MYVEVFIFCYFSAKTKTKIRQLEVYLADLCLALYNVMPKPTNTVQPP